MNELLFSLKQKCLSCVLIFLAAGFLSPVATAGTPSLEDIKKNKLLKVCIWPDYYQAARVSDFARHGSIWATKDLMSKLSTEERDKIDFGVSRQLEDRQHFVPSSYAQIESLVDLKSGRYEKLKDISTLAITEIRSIQTTR